MEQNITPPPQGLIGRYFTEIVMGGGPLAIGLHVLMFLVSAVVLVMAFSRIERALLITLGLLPVTFGGFAGLLHGVKNFMVLGPNGMPQFKDAYLWEAFKPLVFSAIVAGFTIGASLLIRRFSPVAVPPLPPGPPPLPPPQS